MAAFARTRTRSLLSKLWPLSIQVIQSRKVDMPQLKGLLDSQFQKKQQFLKAIKNGGIWFS
ncbi:putative protein family PM-5 [Prochlorococcus marinus str. SS51]|nr:putative protein family PM-5 [Prochlorococcus marinus str. LG]KGG34160.1 putative protein family PM-5 [Prochlorococcus marinus str. SS51]